MTVQPDSRGEDQTRISVVHALFKTHLDIGFTNRAHGSKDSLRNNVIAQLGRNATRRAAAAR